MSFDQWLTANGYDAAALTESQRKHLEAAWKADCPPATPDAYEQEVAAARRENARQTRIRDLGKQAIGANVGSRDKIDQFEQLVQTAIADKWDIQRFELAMLRAERTCGVIIDRPPHQAQLSDEVIEAAICLSHKLPNVEKKFNEPTLEAASKAFRHGIGLKQLMLLGAKQNGFRGDERDWQGVFRATMDRGHYDMRADVGVSTGVQVPGILSNIANKFLASSFMNVEQSWRGIAKIRPVNDFKQTTTYRMSGANTFLRVAPSGEIKHGSLSETSYTNQAKTYGRLLGVSREDYINDDLGAFVSVTQELGRGAADGLNNIFWATWLNDSAFFPTNASKLNYDDGATDSVLSLAGLDNAESIFAVQTKPDGTPLGATPKILLVPMALKNTALTLMQSQITNMATSSVALTGNANIFAGRYNVVASAFLSRTSLNDENGVAQTVTGSSTAWYLLADPLDIPCIEVVFLYGKDTPTVETDQFEFDRLGMATRAFFDFGISLQEYRGGVKLKGAA